VKQSHRRLAPMLSGHSARHEIKDSKGHYCPNATAACRGLRRSPCRRTCFFKLDLPQAIERPALKVALLEHGGLTLNDMREFFAERARSSGTRLQLGSLMLYASTRGPRDKKLRFTDVHEMFLAMREHV
jgi:hypothetical protein